MERVDKLTWLPKSKPFKKCICKARLLVNGHTDLELFKRALNAVGKKSMLTIICCVRPAKPNLEFGVTRYFVGPNHHHTTSPVRFNLFKNILNHIIFYSRPP